MVDVFGTSVLAVSCWGVGFPPHLVVIVVGLPVT